MPLLLVLIIILVFLSTLVGILVYFKGTPEGRKADAKEHISEAEADADVIESLLEAKRIHEGSLGKLK